MEWNLPLSPNIPVWYVSVTRCVYRSGNPLWSSSILPPSCSFAQGQIEVLLPRRWATAEDWAASSPHCARVRIFLLWDEYGGAAQVGGKRTTPTAGFKMSNIRWLERWCLCRSKFLGRQTSPSDTVDWSFCATMKRNTSWWEDMDFARRLFLLLKPQELYSGNDAVNLRVSYVSIPGRTFRFCLSFWPCTLKRMAPLVRSFHLLLVFVFTWRNDNSKK